jgi:hypothetical protein
VALFAACHVEPADLPNLDATFPDADVADAGKDAGATDAAVECSTNAMCPAGQYCDTDHCRVRPASCAETSDCAPDDLCVRPLSATSTRAPGRCRGTGRVRGFCTGGTCAAGACTTAGFCSPEGLAIAGNAASSCASESSCAPGEALAAARSLLLTPRCTAHADCGPAGVCDPTSGACAACASNADCRDQLLCEDGACIERAVCSTDLHCFPENECMSQRCRRASTCATDGGDTRANAVRVEAAHYADLGLCGDRSEAWFAFDITGRDAARMVLTSTVPLATFALDVFDDTGAVVDATYYRMPGIQIVEVGAPGFGRDEMNNVIDLERDLRLRISALDHSGRYDLSLVRQSSLCPGDALDTYGDRSPAALLPILGNRSYELRACPGDVDLVSLAVDAEDVVRLAATFAGSGTDLDLEVFTGRTTAAADRIAAGLTDDVTRESLATGAIPAASELTVAATAKIAPSSGQAYIFDVTRTLGTRLRACRDAGDIALSNGGASVSGDLSGATDLGAPRCDNDRYAAPERNDVLYRVTPPYAPSVFRALLSHAAPSDGELTLAVVTSCAEDGAPVLCDSAELPRRSLSIEHAFTSTAAEPFYILVSSDGPSEDVRFALDLQFDPQVVPPNNACAGSEMSDATAEIQVSTYGATNDVELTGFACGYGDGTAAAADVFYRMRLQGGERAAVELTGPIGGFVWAATDCGQMTNTCTAAADISLATPVAKLAFSPRIATTFFVAVDGVTAADAGTYRLRTVREPDLMCLANRDCASPLRCDDYRCAPVPANDDCNGAEVVTLDASGFATRMGSTGAANENFFLTCTGESDRDVVYQVSLPVDHTELVARIVDARFDPALAIRAGACEASIDERCNDDVRFPDILLPEVGYLQPAAGTYYIIVDAYAGSGTFTLEIEARR